jgi:predicted Rossmann fold flavoprotein
MLSIIIISSSRSLNFSYPKNLNIKMVTILRKIIIIGGGAAGFFGAITAALNNINSEIIILEAGKQPLTKVLISGGGRCNVTHHCFNPAQLITYYPRGGKALRGAFSRFQPQDTVKWFEMRGISLKTEADGRMFPITDNSETIAECLLETARKLGIKLRTNTPVRSVNKLPHNFQIELRNGIFLNCDLLLIATGSNPSGYRFAKQLGHKIITPVPSLFTFNIRDQRLKDLAGIAVENTRVTLLTNNKNKLQQTGALLITHWGMSGPAILKLSAWGARILHDNKYQLQLLINWLPEYNSETLREYLQQFKQENPRKKVITYSPVKLPKRLWQSFINFLGIGEAKNWSELSKKELNSLIQELTQGQYQITGKGVFKEEFVTCGGVNLQEIDFKTMESKICPGLYFAGEVLDIDGVTGGFNFQSAWTTSWIAGQAIANY